MRISVLKQLVSTARKELYELILLTERDKLCWFTNSYGGDVPGNSVQEWGRE